MTNRATKSLGKDDFMGKRVILSLVPGYAQTHLIVEWVLAVGPTVMPHRVEQMDPNLRRGYTTFTRRAADQMGENPSNHRQIKSQ
jgi:hypothetical protein